MHVMSQPNSGPYPARNRALRQVRGEYVAFLDADDYWASDMIEKLVGALRGGADVAYCGWQNVGEGAPGGGPYVPPAYEAGDAVRAFLWDCPWPIHAAVLRRSVADALRGFSQRCFTSMDYDFWLRALTVTRQLVRVPEVLAFYRWHGAGQISAVKWRQVLDALRVRGDFVRDNPSLVAHLERRELRQLIHRPLREQAYRAFWQRDLVSAQRLFRRLLFSGQWNARDLKYGAASLLPPSWYRALIRLAAH
jgi:glycosyltransferase involved in cell wall biosynthesis